MYYYHSKLIFVASLILLTVLPACAARQSYVPDMYISGSGYEFVAAADTKDTNNAVTPSSQNNTEKAEQYHIVKSGDSLYKIGLKTGNSYQDLALWNQIPPPYNLTVGQKISLSKPGQEKPGIETKAQTSPNNKQVITITALKTPDKEPDKTVIPAPQNIATETTTANKPQSASINNAKNPDKPANKAIIPATKKADSEKKLPEKQQPGTIEVVKNPEKDKKNSGISATNKINSKNTSGPKTDTNAPKKSDEDQKKSIISIDNKKMLKLNFQWPIKGKVLKDFSQSHKKGIDIAGKTSKAVSATETGKVVYSGQGLAGFGNLIIIKHNDMYLSAYANNSRLLAKEGQQVKKGQVIAELNETANKPAVLHFEIRKNGTPVNPLELLPK